MRSMRATWAAPGHARWGITSALTAILRISMRPCSLSTDSAIFRSGGRRTGSTGGKGAEAFGDTGSQLGLVVFHHKQVIAFSIIDGLADFALAEDRIARDNCSLQRQFLEECNRGGDFVLAGLHHDIADDRGRTCGEGGEHVQGLGIEPPAAFQRLAVNGDMPSHGAPAGKRTKSLGQGIAIERLKNIVISGMTRRTLNAKQRQRLRLQPPPPAENSAQIVRPGKHRRNSDRKDRLQRKLPPLAAPPVRDCAQSIPQCPCHEATSCHGGFAIESDLLALSPQARCGSLNHPDWSGQGSWVSTARMLS